MSIRVMADVWDFGPNDPIDNTVLLWLANRCNDQGTSCYPSIAEISAKIRRSERTVVRSIAQLEEDGWITVERGTGAGNFSQYTINVRRLKECQSDTHKGGQPVTLPNDKRVTPTTERVTPTTEKGDSGDNPPHPLLGRTVIEPPKEPSTEPDSVDNRILCESIGIFSIRQQEEIFRLYKASARDLKLSPAQAREKIIARWDEYQKKAATFEWGWGSAHGFLISGLWDKPDMWPKQKQSAAKADAFSKLKFANGGSN